MAGGGRAAPGSEKFAATVAEGGDDGDAQSVSRLNSLHQDEDEDEADPPMPSGRRGEARSGGAMVACCGCSGGSQQRRRKGGRRGWRWCEGRRGEGW
jgi:hypothetical protein